MDLLLLKEKLFTYTEVIYESFLNKHISSYKQQYLYTTDSAEFILHFALSWEISIHSNHKLSSNWGNTQELSINDSHLGQCSWSRQFQRFTQPLTRTFNRIGREMTPIYWHWYQIMVFNSKVNGGFIDIFVWGYGRNYRFWR